MSMIAPALTSPSAAFRGGSGRSREDFLSGSDIQSLVEFKRQEESMVTEYYYSQLPYMHLNQSLLINYEHRENENKRMIYSSIEELDRSVSEKNLPYLKEKVQNINGPSFSDWLCEMSAKCQRNKAPQFS